jgi:hypothetical protein
MQTPDPQDDSLAGKLRDLEARIVRIEERLDIVPDPSGPFPVEADTPPPARDEDELEFEVGQNWFAKVGIIVIALGMVFLLTFPYTDLPAAAPGIFGYVLAGGLLLVARLSRESFDIVSRYLRGSGMLLLFFTTLRLFFWGTEPALSLTSPTGPLLILAVLAVNLAIGFRRESPYLVGLALATGFASAIAVGTPAFLLLLTGVLCGIAAYARVRHDWPGVLFFTTLLAPFVYGVWMVNNPFHGNPVLVQAAMPALYALPVYAALLASGTLLRRDSGSESAWAVACSFAAGAGIFGLFLLHSALSHESVGGVPSAIASMVFLGLAVAFWVREQSRLSTFIYAILGYGALSTAIIQTSAVPVVFVWLSAQSILVVGTAVWFRSRFIVVTNFIIYLMIVAGYVAVATEETGISLGFGLVALASARILNWQQNRLELKTEAMRNAYLASAFLVFPFALYHLVPHSLVSLSWVGIALFYYALNLIIRAQKYRWMGHFTLLLTALYVVIIGIVQLEPTYRIISFLVLGTALLVVSLIFTRARARRRRQTGA